MHYESTPQRSGSCTEIPNNSGWHAQSGCTPSPIIALRSPRYEQQGVDLIRDTGSEGLRAQVSSCKRRRGPRWDLSSGTGWRQLYPRFPVPLCFHSRKLAAEEVEAIS
jgi:hypothetical protein